MPIGWLPEEWAPGRLEEPPGVDLGRNEPPATEIVEAGRLIVWTRWRTAEDERVCPECGPLDRHAWPSDEGPRPPLHDRCRCAREFAFTERTSRS